MSKRVFAIAATTLLLACSGAQAIDFRMVTTTDDAYPGTDLLAGGFIRQVEAASRGNIKITKVGPESVPPFEALRPVSAGAFQFLFTNGIYHSGTTMMGGSLDTLSAGDPVKRRASGIFEALDKHYAKHNVKVIALPISKSSGYQIILKAPPNADGDLKGRKIRSTPSYSGVMNLLGATIVVQPPAEVYSSLEKGVVEGATWPAIGVLGAKWYEVAKYIIRPTFGVASVMIMMNLDAWNKLSDGDKTILTDVAKKLEAEWYEKYVQFVQAEEKELLAKGSVIVELGPKQKEQLEAAWAEGIWKLVEAKNTDEAKAFRALAKSQGLTP